MTPDEEDAEKVPTRAELAEQKAAKAAVWECDIRNSRYVSRNPDRDMTADAWDDEE